MRYLLPISSAERFTTRQQGCQRVRRRVYTISRPRPLTRAHAARQVSSPTKAKRAPAVSSPDPAQPRPSPDAVGSPRKPCHGFRRCSGKGPQAVQVQVSLCGKLSQPLASGSPSAQGKADKSCKRTRRRAGEGRRGCKRFPHGNAKGILSAPQRPPGNGPRYERSLAHPANARWRAPSRQPGSSTSPEPE